MRAATTEYSGLPDDSLGSESMLLQPDPSLAELPGFTQEQLDALARSVECRRQQLDGDIRAYIKRKEAELRSYEQDVRLGLHSSHALWLQKS